MSVCLRDLNTVVIKSLKVDSANCTGHVNTIDKIHELTKEFNEMVCGYFL